MKLKQFTTVALLLLVCAVANAQNRPPNLATEGLLGPVKTVELGRLESSANQIRKAEGKIWVFQKLTFDEHGNRVEAIIYNNNGSITERLVYTYDNQHRNTGYDEYSSLISLTVPRKHIYHLDQSGKLVEYAVFDADGSMASRFVYRFDAKGNRT